MSDKFWFFTRQKCAGSSVSDHNKRGHIKRKAVAAKPGKDYWRQRNTVIEILDYISTFEHIENMRHWKNESRFAKMLREFVKNDGV